MFVCTKSLNTKLCLHELLENINHRRNWTFYTEFEQYTTLVAATLHGLLPNLTYNIIGKVIGINYYYYYYYFLP